MSEFLRVVEQRNLLGGADLVYRDRRRHVDGRFKVGFAAALALIVGRAKEPEDVPDVAQCPHCGREGPTDQLFGTRVLQGERRRQSWCRKCRAAPPKPRPIQGALAFT
jgi:hypothetical protein